MQVVAGATPPISVTSCAHIFLFVAFAVGLFLLPCCLLFCLSRCSFSWCFFGSFPACFLLLCKAACYTNLRLLVFVFFGAVVCFYAFYLRVSIHIAPKTRWSVIIPPLYPLWPPRPSLPIMWCFVVRHHTCKICPDHRLLSRFSLFSCPPVLIHPIAPMRAHAHPSAAICAHFAFCFAKHDVRGNFPGHRAQIRVCETIISPPLPCFCIPRAPYTPTHP